MVQKDILDGNIVVLAAFQSPGTSFLHSFFSCNTTLTKRQLPHRFRQVYYLSRVAEELRQYEIKRADKICLRFEGRLFFHQEFQVYESRLKLAIYEIQKSCEISYQPAEPEIVPHYMLHNSVHCKLNGYNGIILLKENRYQLSYLSPKMDHRIWFEPGVFMSLQFFLSDLLLEKLPNDYRNKRGYPAKA